MPNTNMRKRVQYKYEAARRELLASGAPCIHCGGVAEIADHQPPIALHAHVEGAGCCVLVPSCRRCSNRQGGVLGARHMRPAPTPLPVAPEPEGFPADHVIWDAAPWLDALRTVPEDAVWPRLMSAPHPEAVGSLGPEFIAEAEARTGKPLRWWQRLVATRLLEVDADGRLVWLWFLLTLARQLGKSWLLREIILWRIHQADRFGEPQDVMHTGKDLAVCRDVQRPARLWAKRAPDVYHVREANGQEEIELLSDGSRWLVRAKDAVYGYGVSFGAVDEGWAVRATAVDEGLEPTIVEREQGQLLLVSTAHRKATTLMTGRRTLLLAELDAPTGGCLVEWSAPRGGDMADRDAWRMASPHWTKRREGMIAQRLNAAMDGVSDDADELDPLESVRSQWLNQWPLRASKPERGEMIVDPPTWDAMQADVEVVGSLAIAVEDWFGAGAAAAAAGFTEDGRITVGGWTFDTREDAYEWANGWASLRGGSVLLVGASLLNDPGVRAMPVAAVLGRTTASTRSAMSTFREYARTGKLIHDGSPDLGQQVLAARVVLNMAGTLSLGSTQRHDLLRCACWAVEALDRSRVEPAAR